MPDKQKLINSNNPDALLKVLVTVSPFSLCLYTKFYCIVSFACQHSELQETMG